MFSVYLFDGAELEAQAANGEEAGKPANQVEALGEGGESGDIIGGKSLVFATLEVCLCVLVRHVPAINPALPSARGLHTPPPRHRFSEDTCQLISTVLNIMVELPALCSHTGQKLLDSLCSAYKFVDEAQTHLEMRNKGLYKNK